MGVTPICAHRLAFDRALAYTATPLGGAQKKAPVVLTGAIENPAVDQLLFLADGLQVILELPDQCVGHIPGDAVTFLDAAGKVFAVAFGALHIIIRELAPFFLDLGGQLFPLACDAIVLHDVLRDVPRGLWRVA